MSTGSAATWEPSATSNWVEPVATPSGTRKYAISSVSATMGAGRLPKATSVLALSPPKGPRMGQRSPLRHTAGASNVCGLDGFCGGEFFATVTSYETERAGFLTWRSVRVVSEERGTVKVIGPSAL